jgi:hypothetical protein
MCSTSKLVRERLSLRTVNQEGPPSFTAEQASQYGCQFLINNEKENASRRLPGDEQLASS